METIKINFNRELKAITGKALMENGSPVMANKFLGGALVSQRTNGKAMQLYELSCKIYNSEGEIEITPSEKDLIISFLESNDAPVNVLIAAQILTLIKQ